MKALLVLLLAVGCGASQKEACSPLSLRAVEIAHNEAAYQVIAAGKCDAYEKVEQCPAYLEVERYFDPAYTAWQVCR